MSEHGELHVIIALNARFCICLSRPHPQRACPAAAASGASDDSAFRKFMRYEDGHPAR